MGYGYFLYTHALNVPYHDDIYDILRFIMQFDTAGGYGERLDLLLERHNDHRTAASRVIFLVLFGLQGVVDFSVIAFVANLALPLLALLYWLAAGSRADRPLLLLLVLLLLLHPRYYGLMLWPMSAFAFYGVCLYSFLSLYLLSDINPRRFALSIFAALAATYALSSGQLIWVVGLLALLYRGRSLSPWYLLIWCASASFALWLFHHNFANPNPISTVLTYLWNTPLHHARYVLVLLGGGFSFGNVVLAEWLGFIQLMALAFFIQRDRREGLCVLHFFAVFLLLAAMSLALGRAPYSGLDYAMAPRYSFASVNFAIVLLLLSLQGARSLLPAGYALLLLLSSGLCVASYLSYHELLDEHLEQRIKLYNKGQYPLFGQPRRTTNQVVKESIDRGLYQPPPRPLFSHRQQLPAAPSRIEGKAGGE